MLLRILIECLLLAIVACYALQENCKLDNINMPMRQIDLVIGYHVNTFTLYDAESISSLYHQRRLHPRNRILSFTYHNKMLAFLRRKDDYINVYKCNEGYTEFVVSRCKKFLEVDLESFDGCHYNYVKDEVFCYEIKEHEIVYATINENSIIKKNNLTRPIYVNYDISHSSNDEYGNNYLLLKHKLSWIYRINITDAAERGMIYLNVFTVVLPNSYRIKRIVQSSIHHILIEATYNRNSKFYHLPFEGKSQLNSFCVFDNSINAHIGIFRFQTSLDIYRNSSLYYKSSSSYSMKGINSNSLLKYNCFWLTIFTFAYLCIFLLSQFFLPPTYNSVNEFL